MANMERTKTSQKQGWLEVFFQTNLPLLTSILKTVIDTSEKSFAG